MIQTYLCNNLGVEEGEGHLLEGGLLGERLQYLQWYPTNGSDTCSLVIPLYDTILLELQR